MRQEYVACDIQNKKYRGRYQCGNYNFEYCRKRQNKRRMAARTFGKNHDYETETEPVKNVCKKHDDDLRGHLVFVETFRKHADKIPYSRKHYGSASEDVGRKNIPHEPEEKTHHLRAHLAARERQKHYRYQNKIREDTLYAQILPEKKLKQTKAEKKQKIKYDFFHLAASSGTSTIAS